MSLRVFEAVLMAGLLFVCSGPRTVHAQIPQIPRLVGSFGVHGSGPGQFYAPQGMAADRNGNWYVADTDNNRIQIFSREGVFVRQFGVPGTAFGQMIQPTDVAVGPDDNLYVTDSNNCRVEVFTPLGEPLRMWGGYGTGPDQMKYPTALGVDDQGFVYVAEGSRIHKFTSLGSSVSLWGGNGYGAIGTTEGLAFDRDGLVYVSRNKSCPGVWKMTPEGQFLQEMCGPFRGTPQGLAVTADGMIHVADELFNRLQMFSPDGTFLGAWGDGTPEGVQMHYPVDVCVSPDGTIAVVDSGNDRILLFRLGVSTTTKTKTFGRLKSEYR